MSKLTVDLDLVQKYNVAGPRYTSYPPATKFSDLNMLVSPGGRERTREEFSDLFARSGFELTLVCPAGARVVIEAPNWSGFNADRVDVLLRPNAALALRTAKFGPPRSDKPVALRRAVDDMVLNYDHAKFDSLLAHKRE